eukprot:1389568-Pleurochrysis_carterae.AAC.1
MAAVTVVVNCLPAMPWLARVNLLGRYAAATAREREPLVRAREVVEQVMASLAVQGEKTIAAVVKAMESLKTLVSWVTEVASMAEEVSKVVAKSVEVAGLA